VVCLISDIQILSFEPSIFQKNGKEIRVAKVNSYGKLEHLNNYQKYRTQETPLGKMETFVNVATNHKQFNN
jgi:hypothetical protein